MTRTTPRSRISGLLLCSLRLLLLLAWAGTACSNEETFAPLTATPLGDYRIEASRTDRCPPRFWSAFRPATCLIPRFGTLPHQPLPLGLRLSRERQLGQDGKSKNSAERPDRGQCL
jgi:hypothetical protein